MANRVRVEDHFGRDYTDDEFRTNPASLAQAWRTVFLFAHLERIASIHYRPCEADGGLSVFVAGRRRAIHPIAPWLPTETLLGAVRSLFEGPPRRRWFGRRPRRVATGTTCGTVEVELVGQILSVWDAVVWTTGERDGADLFVVPHLSLPPADDPESDTEHELLRELYLPQEHER